MGRTALFHPAAQAEFRAAVAFYDGERAGLGTAFRERVREIIDLALAFPEMGAPLHVAGVRRVFPREFPYAVVYLVAETHLVIIAVAHTHRAPGYWGSRLASPERPR